MSPRNFLLFAGKMKTSAAPNAVIPQVKRLASSDWRTGSRPAIILPDSHTLATSSFFNRL